MSDITPNEEGQKNEEAVIPASAEQSAQIVPSETPAQAEEAESIEELKQPIQFEPIFKAQPLEVVAQSSSYNSTTAEAKPEAKSKLKKIARFLEFLLFNRGCSNCQRCRHLFAE